MTALRRLAALALCLALTYASPGPRGWAAAVSIVGQGVGTGISAVPGAGAAALNTPLHLNSNPSLGGFSGVRLRGVLPGTGNLISPAPSAALRLKAAAAPAVDIESLPILKPAAMNAAVPSVKEFKTAQPGVAARLGPRAALRVRTKKLTVSAAPSITIATGKDCSPADAHGAGRSLQALLTGKKPRAGNGSVPVRGRSEAWKSHAHGLAHDGHHHIEPVEAGADVPAPEVTPEQKRRYRLYKYGTSSIKIGIEVLHLAVPILLITHFGASKTAIGLLMIGAELAGMAAGWMSGSLIDRLKPPHVMAVTAGLQAAAVGAVALLFALGVPIGLPVFGTLFIAGGALAGVFEIARRAGMPYIVGNHQGTLREYNGDLYLYRESAAMAGDFGAGALAKWIGYAGILWLHPLSYAVAAVLYMKLALRSKAAAPLTPKEREPLKAKIASLFQGARIVFNSPHLLTGALVNIPVYTLHKLFHTMVAAVYAIEVLDSPAMAAVLMLAWNAGEFAAAGIQKRYGGKKGKVETYQLLRYGAVAGLSAWLLWLFPTIYVAAPVAFLLATATLSAELGLASLFGSAAKKEELGAVNGFVYPLASAVALGALYGMGMIFDTYSPLFGIKILAAVLTGVSLFYLLSARYLHRLHKKTSLRFFD